MRLEELKKLDKEKRWLIENLIPLGEIAILYAPQNWCKTLIAVKIALEVMTGSSELGHTQKGRVSYINTDNPNMNDLRIRFLGLIQEKYSAKEEDIGINLDVWADSDLDLTKKYHTDDLDNDPDDIDSFISWETSGKFDYQEDIKLVIIDTFSGAFSGSVNDDAAVRTAIKNLKSWVVGGKHTFSILVIAHAGKNTSKGIMGSSLHHNDFPTILSIRKHKKKYWKLYREKLKSNAEGKVIPFKVRETVFEGQETIYADIGEALNSFEAEIVHHHSVGLERLEIFNKMYADREIQQPNKESFRVMFGRKYKNLVAQGHIADTQQPNKKGS